MAALSVLDFGHDSLADQDHKMLGAELDTYQFVDPRHTDKRYPPPHGLTITTSNIAVPNGPVTPKEYVADPASRRPSLVPTETSSFWKSAPSSVSSFGSSPCLTPANTNESSSCRQSVPSPESQQYYLSALSSPSSRPQKSRDTQGFNNYTPQAMCALHDAVNCTAASSFSTDDSGSYEDEGVYAMALEGYADPPQSVWPDHQSSGSLPSTLCQQAMHLDASASLSIDLVGDFQTYSMSGQERETSPIYINDVRDGLFEDPVLAQSFTWNPASTDANTHTLDSLWEYIPAGCESDTDFVDDEYISHIATASRSRSRRAIAKYHRGTHSQRKLSESRDETFSIFDHKDLPKMSTVNASRGKKKRSCQDHESSARGQGAKGHQCLECPDKFARPEHLHRHWISKHDLTAQEHPCLVPDCMEKDKITHKKIKARKDNLAPHYQNTHFKWGNSEKSGKNRRISLKESHKLGLTNLDARWGRFLEGGISVDINDKNHPYEWKMLGYSIKETQETSVKDLFPNMEGHEKTILKDLDWRWAKMMEGSMTYDTAMTTGNDILVDARLGLLGVDMFETEKMSIAHIEPRWIKLRSGSMSIEDSEMLGVKHLNPTWTAAQERRRR